MTVSQEVSVKCSKCGAERSSSDDAVQPFYCVRCGAVLTSPLDDAAGPKRDIRKHLVITIPFIVLVVWFGYLWFVSGVLPSVTKYDNGQPKWLGYVKREGLVTYKRTGHWVTYHPNGQKASEGEYEHGERVEGTWKYWDAAGQPSDTPVGDTLPD